MAGCLVILFALAGVDVKQSLRVPCEVSLEKANRLKKGTAEVYFCGRFEVPTAGSFVFLGAQV